MSYLMQNNRNKIVFANGSVTIYAEVPIFIVAVKLGDHVRIGGICNFFSLELFNQSNRIVAVLQRRRLEILKKRSWPATSQNTFIQTSPTGSHVNWNRRCNQMFPNFYSVLKCRLRFLFKTNIRDNNRGLFLLRRFQPLQEFIGSINKTFVVFI